MSNKYTICKFLPESECYLNKMQQILSMFRHNISFIFKKYCKVNTYKIFQKTTYIIVFALIKQNCLLYLNFLNIDRLS